MIKTETKKILGTAIFSPDRVYRYELWRWWDKSKGYLMVVGLNPSTADETQNDPTIRRCMGFAKRFGYGGLCMTNMFAFRATSLKVMKAQVDPVGPDNAVHLHKCSANAGMVLAAWGMHGAHMKQHRIVPLLIKKRMLCLGYTSSGHPRHPLFMKADTKPVRYFAR